MANVVTAIGQWLNSAKGKIIAPKTLTKYVFDENGKSVEERFTLINTDAGNTIDVILNKETYEMTVILKNKNGEELSSKTVDFPMELAFVNASYVEGQKKITFTLQSGAEVEVPLAKLIEGLVNTEDFNAAIDEIKSNIPIYTNLIKPYDANSSEFSDRAGIEVYVYDDGSKIKLYGTATEDVSFCLCSNIKIKRAKGNPLKLVGCPKGGSSTTYCIRLVQNDSNTYYDYGNGVEIPVSNYTNTYSIYIDIKNGTVIGDDGLVFYLMLTNNINAKYEYSTPYIGSYATLTDNLLSEYNKTEETYNHMKSLKGIENSIGLCKNMIILNFKTFTDIGLTFSTVLTNERGTFTINGTSTNTTTKYIQLTNYFKLQDASDMGGGNLYSSFILTGATDNVNLCLRGNLDVRGSADIRTGLNKDTIFSVYHDAITCLCIAIQPNSTFDNVTVKPALSILYDRNNININANFIEGYGYGGTVLDDISNFTNDIYDINKYIGKCKNYCKIDNISTTQNGVTVISDNDGIIHITGTASENLNLNIGSINISKSKFGNNIKVTATKDGENETLCILKMHFKTQDKTYYIDNNVGSVINLANDNEEVDLILYIPASKTFNDYLIKPMVTTNLNAIYDDFVPYISDNDTLVEDIVDMKNDSYDLKILGWTVPKECPIKNTVSNNIFTQNVGRIDLGTVEWVYRDSAPYFYFVIPTTYIKYIGNFAAVKHNVYCFKYLTVKRNDTEFIDKTMVVDGNINTHTISQIQIKDSSYTDAAAFKQAMRGVYLYYELATPITMTIDGNEKIDQIDDSLSLTRYGEVAGGKNLLDYNTIVSGILTDNTFNVSNYNATVIKTLIVDLPKGDYVFSASKPIVMLRKVANNTFADITTGSVTSYGFSTNGGKVGLSFRDATSGNTEWTYRDLQIEEGLTATAYEPYIPSVKMLADNSDTIIGDINKIEKDLDIARYGEFSGSKNLFDESAEKFFKYSSSAYMVYQIPFTGYYMLSMSFKEGKTISDLAGISFGGVITPDKPGTEYKWYISNGAVSTLSFYSNYPFLFIYPGTNESVDKVLSTLNIMIEKSNTVSEYEKYFMSNTNQYNALTNLQKNLLVKQKINTIKGVILGTDGSYDSSYDEYRCTDYIKVLPLTLIKVELAASSDDFCVAFYDENKAYVDKEKRLSGGITKNTIIGYTSINTQYIRICYRAASNPTDYVYLYTTNSDTSIEPIKNAIGSYKNLLNIYKYSYMSGPCTINGITCTFNTDGTYTVNGTATDNAYFLVENVKEIAKKYVNKPLYLTGCPANGGGGQYDLRYEINNTAGNGGCTLFNTSYEIARNNILSADKITDANIYIAIKKGVTVKNLVFKPMLTEYPTDGYNSFLPPIGSNSNIQNDIFDIKQRQFSRWAQGNSSITINLQGVYLMSYWQGAGWPVVGCGILSSSNYKESSKYTPLVSESSITVTPNGNYTVTIKNNVAAAITMYFTKLSV